MYIVTIKGKQVFSSNSRDQTDLFLSGLSQGMLLCGKQWHGSGHDGVYREIRLTTGPTTNLKPRAGGVSCD